MGHHDFVVPIRFLALVGHFFSALLTLYAIKDNCIVALPFLYEQSDLDSLVGSASAALVLCFCVLAVNAVSFFGGFSTFDLPISIFHIFMHTVESILLSIVVIAKGHYMYVWFIVGIGNGLQLLAEVYTFTTVMVLGKRRW